MVDNEYSPDNCKSLKTSIGVIIKTPEMLRFVLDQLKTKRLQKVAVSNKVHSWSMKNPSNVWQSYTIKWWNVNVSPHLPQE